MTPGRRRPIPATAVVGLVIGLVLLCGAIVDGGLRAPTRGDRSANAVDRVAAERSVPHDAATREDGAAWDDAGLLDDRAAPRLALAPPSPAVGLVAGALLVAISRVREVGRRDRARVPARHRGPPLAA